MIKKVKKKETSINDLITKIEKGFTVQEKRFDDKLENLALMVAKGFEHVDKRFEQIDSRFDLMDQRFEQVDKRFEQVDRRFAHIEATLSTVQRDIEGIQREMVYKDEMEDLMARVKYVEMKLGIESGK